MSNLKRPGLSSFALSPTLFLWLASTGCGHSAMTPMSTGNVQSGSGTWTQGNAYTPIGNGAVNAGTGAAGGTQCSSTNSDGSGNNCRNATPWDTSDANKVLNGISPVNPAQPGVSSDLAGGISDLLRKAAADGAASVEQSCDSHSSAVSNQQNGCFDRYSLGAQILQSCMANQQQFRPLPGEPLIGDYNAGCYKITASVDGEYNDYLVHFHAPLPQLPKEIHVQAGANGGGWSKSGVGSLGTLHYQFSMTDEPTAASGTFSFYNKKAHTKCNTSLTMSHSRNPIPAKVAQGMKSLSDCYRKALLLMSPLFDTMFSNMPREQAATLLAAAMGGTL